MPRRAARRCSTPGCPGTPGPDRSRCARCAANDQRRRDAARGTPAERGYTTAWSRRAATFLRAHPRCVDCGGPATVADHAPRSRRQLVAAGVADPDAPQYLQARCAGCDRRRSVRDEGTLHPGGRSI